MSVFTHHGVRYSAPLLAFFTHVARRLADSPLDHAALYAASTHTPAPLRATVAVPARPHAHWQAVVREDGHRRGETRRHSGD
ncbi:hypothetical protein GCM10010289_80920 [Streptomyces violascens]|uniref:Uncharacterized protein n=1 Tax=Streptomyces violascens TaxID=67381 RepID=A0ABQ3QS90_9ACTN|nr:hypothetical protein GCM10010289_80920 [Streptomyces violascens]GHI40127.1 hypothetical protein Sviol_45350 [Streptomyces violascens]